MSEMVTPDIRPIFAEVFLNVDDWAVFLEHIRREINSNGFEPIVIERKKHFNFGPRGEMKR